MFGFGSSKSSGFSLSSIGNWASNAYTRFTTKTSAGRNFAGFLADPLGAVTNYAVTKAADFAKQSISQRFASYDERMDTGVDIKYTSAESARSGTPSYGTFQAGTSQIPGMRNSKVATAFDKLYNAPELKSENVRVTVQYTRPNINPSSGTITLGSSSVPRQKIATKSIKTSLKRR
jgi:hypothetical protein